MNLYRLTLFALLPGLVATAVVWAVTKQARRELESFDGFDGLHLET